jgi:2-polyprenyl-3-methyl-5-hydroxy-6-metoxy-1,4-benzoquinol methylase
MNERRGFLAIAYRYRLVGKRAVFFLSRILPRSLAKPITALAEKAAFWMTPQYQGDTLPSIFHYWSHKYLAPKLAEVGLKSPEDLYYQQALKQANLDGRSGPLRVLSLGSGAGELELGLLQKLLDEGIDVRIECVDFNPHLKRIAEQNASERGLSDCFEFTVRDCNSLESIKQHDLVIVNQFFHHVEDLDAFCAAIKRQLMPDGALLTSDVIGRNGHVLWPSVDKYVQFAWASLENKKRFDRYFGAEQSTYVSVDHSLYSNEGIRAQEIVGKLLKYFDFELFITYGASIMPFIERRIGFNFSIESEVDRNFIDKIALADEKSLHSGDYPASNMVAVLRQKGRVRDSVFMPISPEEHVRLTLKEASSV